MKINYKLVAFLLLLLISFLTQLAYIQNSIFQIRLEEISESVRNVWWFQNGYVFSGINTHLGWYSLLNVAYNIFGFTFETAKYVKLVLYLVSVVCLFQFLVKYFDYRKVVIPFLVIIFSPTILFFNSLASHYGVDLLYLPIVLYLFSEINLKSKPRDYLITIGMWAVVMYAWLSYPTFIYYLPFLGIVFIYKLLKQKKRIVLYKYVAVSLVGFLLPFLVLSLPIKNKDVLLKDQVSNRGVFMGAGYFDVNFDEAGKRVGSTLKALGGVAESYYYEVEDPDFSKTYPTISIGTTLLGVILAWRMNKFRIPILALLTLFLINFFAIAFLADTGGYGSVRRATGMLAAFWGLYILVFIYFVEVPKRFIKYLFIFFLILLPIHHLQVYRSNLTGLANLSPQREQMWFEKNSKTPTANLEDYTKLVKSQELKLTGYYAYDDDFGYVYNWIYGSVAGSCFWNKIQCRQISGFDKSVNKFVPLNFETVNYFSKKYRFR